VKPKDEAKAREIFAATLEEVEKVGLAGLSIEAVARRAGVATGTVYIYYKNKEALLEALYIATKSELAGLVFRDEGLPIRLAFARMVAAFLDYVIEHHAEMVFMSQMSNSPYLSARTRETMALGTRPLTELLERGKREHILKDLDSELMLTFLQGTLRELAPLAAAVPRSRRKSCVEAITTLCWDALKS
jgi:AcrR family transcriptional regulator